MAGDDLVHKQPLPLQLPLPYPAASSLRWLAFCAGRQSVAARAGETRIARQVEAMRAVGVPEVVLGLARCSSHDAFEAARAAAGAAAPEGCAVPFEALMSAVVAEARRGVEVVFQYGRTKEAELPHDDAVENLSGCGRFWGLLVQGCTKAAHVELCLALRGFHQLHWGRPPWRGANLGGWLLLEPGPASPFFETCKEHLLGCEAILEDEHSMCCALEAAGGAALREQAFKEHRATHYGEDTFRRMADCGLNAVRLPFGHWVVHQPGADEAFQGPCLEVLDRAVEFAGRHNLQLLLDLHGNPGSENGDRPSGRKSGSWSWTSWRRQEAVEVLRTVACRYKSADCVTGLQVCNEPSPNVPIAVLCSFYEEAVEAVRAAGMGPDRVAVVLPIFTHWRLAEVVECWRRRGNFLKYDNIAFDLHYYHDFCPVWGWLSQKQHLDATAEHAREVAQLPGAVVGEWSLARPCDDFCEEEMAEFARHQVLAYNHASHGWFFWNWHDYEFYPNWDMERGILGRQRLPSPLGPKELGGLLFPAWAATRPPSWPARRAPVPWVLAASSWLLGAKAKFNHCARRNPSCGCWSWLRR